MGKIDHMLALQRRFIQLWPKIESLRSAYRQVSDETPEQMQERLDDLSVAIPNGEHGVFSPAHNVKRQGDTTKFELVPECTDCATLKNRYDPTDLIVERNQILEQIEQATELHRTLKPANTQLAGIIRQLRNLANNLGLPSYAAPSYDDGTIIEVEAKVAKNVRFRNELILERGRALVYSANGIQVGAIFDTQEKIVAINRGDGRWRLPGENPL